MHRRGTFQPIANYRSSLIGGPTPAHSFVPTDISGLEFWVRGDQGVIEGSNPGFCAEWRDLSGYNRHARQSTLANQPAIAPAWLNGHQALHFDGDLNQWLSNEDGWLINNPSTAIAVFFYDFVSSNISIVFDQNGPLDAHHALAQVQGDGGGDFLFIYARQFLPIQTFAASTSPVYVIGTFNELNSEISNDAIGDAGTMPQLGITIGQGQVIDRNYPMYGYIGEIMIFNKILSLPETNSIKTYLNSFWGL